MADTLARACVLGFLFNTVVPRSHFENQWFKMYLTNKCSVPPQIYFLSSCICRVQKDRHSQTRQLEGDVHSRPFSKSFNVNMNVEKSQFSVARNLVHY